MLPVGICLAVALIVIWRQSRTRQQPLDRYEIRVLKHCADQIRREQFHPFD